VHGLGERAFCELCDNKAISLVTYACPLFGHSVVSVHDTLYIDFTTYFGFYFKMNVSSYLCVTSLDFTSNLLQ